MKGLQVQFLRIAEARWLGSRLPTTNNKVFYYSENNYRDHWYRIGIILNTDIGNAVSNFVPLSDWCRLIQLAGSPVNINLIQIYAPTADKPLGELEKWYKDRKLLKYTRKEEITVIMGDINFVGNFG